MDASTSRPAVGSAAGPAEAAREPVPAGPSGGMLLALVMDRRPRGLRGLDLLRRSRDRAPPQR